MTKPTASELEILQILWKKGECTVREVNEELIREKKTGIGYTTTLKLMQIMLEKGQVIRNNSNRTHIYTAVLSKAKTSQTLLGNFIDTVFNGSSAQLVMQALSNKKASAEEISMIRKYLNDLEKDQEEKK